MADPNRRNPLKNTKTSSEEISEEDMVFAFMGPTGTGKSTFIDLLTGQEGTRSGKGLKSVTHQVEATSVSHPRSGERVVLVDTPGFDDTYMGELEVLQLIADWLGKAYKLNIKLSGIVYLTSIADRRMQSSTIKNLRMFERLCGESAMKSVVLTTTMWKDVSLEDGEEREAELISDFWKPMIDNGATVDRLKAANHDEAWRVVDGLIKKRTTKSNRAVLLLQKELVDLEQKLNETEAGKEINESLQDVLTRAQSQRKAIYTAQKMSDDRQVLKELEDKLTELETRITKVNNGAEKKKVPLLRRIFRFFKLCK